MWISPPTPVISSTNAIDSGSSRSPKSTLSASTAIQLYSESSLILASGALPRKSKKISRPTTNAVRTVPQPSQWPHLSVRRPPTNSTSAPSAGSAISSQASPAIPVASGITGIPISGGTVVTPHSGTARLHPAAQHPTDLSWVFLTASGAGMGGFPRQVGRRSRARVDGSPRSPSPRSRVEGVRRSAPPWSRVDGSRRSPPPHSRVRSPAFTVAAVAGGGSPAFSTAAVAGERGPAFTTAAFAGGRVTAFTTAVFAGGPSRAFSTAAVAGGPSRAFTTAAQRPHAFTPAVQSRLVVGNPPPVRHLSF